MKIEDYLPKYILQRHSGTFTLLVEYDLLSIKEKIGSLINMGLPLCLKEFKSDKRTIIYYYSLIKGKNVEIILYDSEETLDFDIVLEKTIESFNEKIGNVHDYVDTYRKRNLILKDLI